MTSRKKHSAPPKPSLSKHRATIAAFMGEKRHLLSSEPLRAKTVRVIAAETGMSIRTARYWLERDHYDEWFRWWPSFAAIVADVWEGRDMNAGSSAPLDLPDFNPADDDVR